MQNIASYLSLVILLKVLFFILPNNYSSIETPCRNKIVVCRTFERYIISLQTISLKRHHFPPIKIRHLCTVHQLIAVVMTLGVLSRHLVTEGVSASSGSLLLKGAVHRASGEASQAIAVASRSGRRLIAVAIGRRRQGTVVELNSAGVEAVVEALSAFASAGVSVAGSAHNVAELDATSLAVP